jgi:cell shape-determining protein MreC
LVVTSAADQVFPEGLRVGVVERVGSRPATPGITPQSGLMLEIEVRPFVRFWRLDEVLLLSTGGMLPPAVELDAEADTEPEAPTAGPAQP